MISIRLVPLSLLLPNNLPSVLDPSLLPNAAAILRVLFPGKILVFPCTLSLSTRAISSTAFPLVPPSALLSTPLSIVSVQLSMIYIEPTSKLILVGIPQSTIAGLLLPLP